MVTLVHFNRLVKVTEIPRSRGAAAKGDAGRGSESKDSQGGNDSQTVDDGDDVAKPEENPGPSAYSLQLLASALRLTL